MSNLNQEIRAGFYPCNKQHSIKNASLIFLLDRPFYDIESLGNQLVESDSFASKNNDINHINFLFSGDFSEVKQEQKKVGIDILDHFGNSVICVNELHRNFLSYKTTNYTRWDQFRPKAFESLSALAKQIPESKFQVFALEYVDEFLWKGELENMSLAQLFKDDGKLFPTNFLDGNTTSFQIVRHKRPDTSSMVFEEIQIGINPEPGIFVRHHVTGSLDEFILLESLDNQTKFTELLTQIHGYNKEMLKELLSEDMSRIIGLLPPNQ